MNGWMKSLHCKSNAPDDVVHHHQQHHHHRRRLHNHSCRSSIESLKDVVDTTRKAKPKKPKPPRPPQPPPFRRPISRKPSEHGPSLQPAVKSGSFFPCLSELPMGHPSRNVVEIIFHTSWGEKGFPGRVEMVLKVQNSTRTASRFEEYREAVRQRASRASAGEDHSRCVVDGNEVMRFYCLGDTANGGTYECGGGALAFTTGGKMAGVCTFSGSGAAHENAGGGRGRRAMLVCRVIAGRVCKQLGIGSLLQIGQTGYDSVGGDNGELLVFDTTGLLPCFLIIYQL